MKQLLSSKKRVVYFSMLAILMLTGLSYAIWQFSFLENNPNLAMSACFDLSFEEANDISLTNAYPLTDDEGKSLTPYTFTIKNKCSDFASYQVNLEVLNNSTLDSSYVKSEFNDRVKLVSSYPTTAKTLNNASTAYKLLSGYLNPNESITYNLKLWIDYNSTVEQSANKTYETKITIASTYKGTNPSELEECIKNYGENSLKCAIMAQADPENSRCLKLDENGQIIYPNTTVTYMYDDYPPIICTMEDEYGISYYLRGNHISNNVKFANSCWKLLRVTGNDGIKLLYNGDLDENGNCTTTSGNHTGFKGQWIDLSGNKAYGASYIKEENNYKLIDTSTMNYSTDSNNIIGKYTCGNTNTSCSDIYWVIGNISQTNGYALKLNQDTNYAQIGTSAFNSYYYTNQYNTGSSLAYIGYMYNDVYRGNEKNTTSYGENLLTIAEASQSNYYYGDTISYENGDYYITNQDGSNVEQLPWANNFQNNLVGKYTCRSTSKENDTTIKCAFPVKVLDTTTKENYMIAEFLWRGRTSVGIIKLSSDYIDNGDGTYTLKGPIEEITPMEWYNNYKNYQNYYVCEDYNQTVCSKLYMIFEPSDNRLSKLINIKNDYYYGNSFLYDDTKENPYTLINTTHFYNFSDNTNRTALNTHHYTCFNASDNTCTELYYIYYISGPYIYYIKINGNESGVDALNKMVNNNDINTKDSTIKTTVDAWYEKKLKNTIYENYLQDVVFCGDRSIKNYGGWLEDGNNTDYLKFSSHFYLKCDRKNDAFTVDDVEYGNGALKYPIGLLSSVESLLFGNFLVNSTGSRYWSLGGYDYYALKLRGKSVNEDGIWNNNSEDLNSSYGVRPVIALKPTAQIKLGTDGTALNPYEIE